MSLINDAVDIHVDTLLSEDVAGESVTFHRGSSVIGQDGKLFATLGKTDWDEVTGGDAGETYIGTHSTDFLFRTGDLRLGGELVNPQRGDEIRRQDGSRYRVIPGIANVPSQPNDGRENLFRVHTQKIKPST